MTVGYGSSSAEIEEFIGLASAIPHKRVSFKQKQSKSMSVRSAGSGQAQVALFLSPPNLEFVGNDISTYKQFITIFNPYGFNIRFRAFCTSHEMYELSPGSGTVPAMKSMDVVVRLKDFSNATSGAIDCFRFKIFEQANVRNVLGEREVGVQFLAENPTPSEKVPRESFRPQRVSAIRRPHNDAHVEADSPQAEPKAPLLVIIVGVACLMSLCLPTNGETPESWLARYITLSVNQKLIAAFVLGMVTMVVFRTR